MIKIYIIIYINVLRFIMKKRIPEINELDLFADRINNMFPSIEEQFNKLKTLVSGTNLFNQETNYIKSDKKQIRSLPKIK